MTDAQPSDLPQDPTTLHATVADLHGRALLGFGRPLVGKAQFVQRVVRHADAENRETLHVAATRGYGRLSQPLPEQTYVVDCSPAPGTATDRVTDIATPADLTGIGMAISRFLERADPRPVVTLDSVSTLLAYNDDAVVFRFLAVLVAQIRQVGGVGVFLVEDGCHDTSVVSTFQQLIDGCVDIEPERVRVRGLDDVSPNWTPR